MNLLDHAPLVSVILPVYNGAEYVALAIDSALSQTYLNLEVLAIDDGSVDGSLSILQLYAEKDSRVRVLHQSNQGVAKARNKGIEQARGELIAPLDADDLWQPSKIARQVQCLLQAGSEAGLVYCWWVWIDGGGIILDRSPRWTVQGSAFEALLQVNFTGNASVPLFWKRCVVEVGGYDTSLAAAQAGGCEDWELVLRIADRYEIAVVPEILLGYRRVTGSMSTACDTMWRSKKLVLRQMRNLKHDVSKEVWKMSDRQFAMYLAGLSFWSGRIVAAIGWGLRAGFRLGIAVFPHVLQMLVRKRQRAVTLNRMIPGVPIRADQLPEALIPYDKIYSFKSR